MPLKSCKNNPENSSATKVSEHISSDFSMSPILCTIYAEVKIS